MAVMIRFTLLCLVALGVHANQEQETDSGPFGAEDLSSQVKELQKNITEVWQYVSKLRDAMSQNLIHLRQHQMQIESVIHQMAHHGNHHTSDSHTAHSHTQEDEQSFPHSDDHSSHGSDDHHHHDDHHESSSADHSHHTDEHKDESHSHTDHHHDDHTDSKEEHHHHGDSKEDHGHHNHEEGHDDHHHGHSDEEHHSHSSDHHDHSRHDHSKETESKDNKDEQTQQEEVAEEVVVATKFQSHHHDHSTKSDPLVLLDMHSSHGHSHSHQSHHHTVTNRTTFPRSSEYDQYSFATCTVEPNKAIPEDQQQDVRGHVAFWQKKEGGPLGIHVKLAGFKIGSHHGHQQHRQERQQEGNDAAAEPEAVTGHRHGFHVHQSADLSNGCQSTGPHYNPKGVNHGGPTASGRHVGDLGNIECDDHGFTNIVFKDEMASLSGPYSIIGKSLVIHANADDYGLKPDDDESLRTGNAGTRIACCVIQPAVKLPFRTMKAMKIAKHHQNR